jgi:hypothetical protein
MEIVKNKINNQIQVWLGSNIVANLKVWQISAN